jgi:hypothetical protein
MIFIDPCLVASSRVGGEWVRLVAQLLAILALWASDRLTGNNRITSCLPTIRQVEHKQFIGKWAPHRLIA